MLAINGTLMELGFLGNEDVGDKRVIEIADEFEKDSSQTVLKIRDFKVGVRGAKRIGELLKTTVSLEELNLLFDNWIGDVAASLIAEGLEKNTSLKVLNLEGCGISDEGAKRIGQMLEMNGTLIHLNLEENYSIGDEGAIRIAEGLEMNTSLKILDLEGCQIGSKGAKRIGEMLEMNGTLIHLNLEGNRVIGDEGAIRIAEGLEKNTSLKILNIKDCGADEEGAKRMGQMLAINGTLMELRFLGNEDVGDKRVIEIADEFEKDSSQRVFKIRHFNVVLSGAKIIG
jgi:Ran GTPase-activating protein (RanGAP) involved in mRNA processing and transport